MTQPFSAPMTEEPPAASRRQTWQDPRRAARQAARSRNPADRVVDVPPGKPRNAYILRRHREGASYRVIGRELGLSPGSVPGRLKCAEQEADRARKAATWDQRATRLPDLDLKALHTRVERWSQVWTPQRQHDELRREARGMGMNRIGAEGRDGGLADGR